jgi:putative transposase
VQLVEQHVISREDPRFEVIDAAAFAAKNLYNAALYVVRQAYILEGRYMTYLEVVKRMQQHEAYKALPAKVAQQVLIVLGKNWQAFFTVLEIYTLDTSKLQSKPTIPRYKHKTEGRFLLVYTEQAISKRELKHGLIRPSKLPIVVRTRQTNIAQVRIVPRKDYYVAEVVYDKEQKQADVDPALYAGIDIGVNNLATIASNKARFIPIIVNGRPVKSINQYYNKRRAELQQKCVTAGKDTMRMVRLATKRNRRIDHYLHTASRKVIDLLIQEGIGTLVIGKNPEWKQRVKLGSRTNQNFVQIPHARFIEMLIYKAELVGIRVFVVEESYTSKCSFLDLEPIQKHEHYLGKRVKRGLFRAANGRFIHADVNAAYNIIRKVAPDAFTEGVEDVLLHPVRIANALKPNL